MERKTWSIFHHHHVPLTASSGFLTYIQIFVTAHRQSDIHFQFSKFLFIFISQTLFFANAKTTKTSKMTKLHAHHMSVPLEMNNQMRIPFESTSPYLRMASDQASTIRHHKLLAQNFNEDKMSSVSILLFLFRIFFFLYSTFSFLRFIQI